MCFSPEMSFGFSALALLLSFGTYAYFRHWRLSLGIFYFFLMEFLQGVSYSFVASSMEDPTCDTLVNMMLTYLGFFHICFQPVFSNLLFSSIVRSRQDLVRANSFVVLGFLGGLSIVFSHILATSMNDDPLVCAPYEWLRAPKLCTFHEDLHLSWSVPLRDTSYFVAGSNLHFFCMFAPIVILGIYDWVFWAIGAILFLGGPWLAMQISPSKFEQPAIWCFFSILQIACILLVALVVRGKPTSFDNNVETSPKKKKQ